MGTFCFSLKLHYKKCQIFNTKTLPKNLKNFFLLKNHEKTFFHEKTFCKNFGHFLVLKIGAGFRDTFRDTFRDHFWAVLP